MDKAVYEILTSETAITDLISDRAFPVQREQDSGFPALVFKKINSPVVYNNDGKVGYMDVYFDVFIYGNTYEEVNKLVELLKNKLSGKSGTFGDKQVRFVEIGKIGNDDYLEDLDVYTDSIEMKVEFVGN